MDQIIAHATTIINQAEEYSVPATKIAIPLAGLYLASKALGTFWRRFLGPLLIGEVKWRLVYILESFFAKILVYPNY